MRYIISFFHPNLFDPVPQFLKVRYQHIRLDEMFGLSWLYTYSAAIRWKIELQQYSKCLARILDDSHISSHLLYETLFVYNVPPLGNHFHVSFCTFIVVFSEK